MSSSRIGSNPARDRRIRRSLGFILLALASGCASLRRSEPSDVRWPANLAGEWVRTLGGRDTLWRIGRDGRLFVRDLRAANDLDDIEEGSPSTGRWWTEADAHATGGRKLCFKYPRAARFYRCASFELGRSADGPRELELNGSTFAFRWLFRERR